MNSDSFSTVIPPNFGQTDNGNPSRYYVTTDKASNSSSISYQVIRDIAENVAHKEIKEVNKSISDLSERAAKLEKEIEHIIKEISDIKEDKKLRNTRNMSIVALIISSITALATLINTIMGVIQKTN